MERWLEIAKTVPRLGLVRVARVARHRWRARAGYYRKAHFDSVETGTLWHLENLPASELTSAEAARVIAEAEKIVAGRVSLFGAREVNAGSPPRWHENPLSPSAGSEALRHWSAISDFDASFGDIKGVWELSRLGWAPVLAQATLATGDMEFARTIENWTRDWWEKNPWGYGRNWKCGQESGLRLLHLLQAAQILGVTPATSTRFLNDFVAAHAHRIDLTRDYAKGQANNHALSEAVALFVAGEWLRATRAGRDTPETRRWRRHGREDLEEAVEELFESDGTFAQYSTNYHRVALDLLSHACRWGAWLTPGAPFSETFTTKARAATAWLASLIDERTGDVPNLGSNDGAHIFNDTAASYRDFRPSVARAHTLFGDTESSGPARSREFSLGGFVILRTGASWGCLRTPRDHFRPVQADAFHLDLWHGGVNLLRDAGTYSYFDPEGATFSSCKGHNTLQFDGRDHMPKISRFLYGSWTNTHTLSPLREEDGALTWAGKYSDAWGIKHRRSLEARPYEWRVRDEFEGHQREAIARWRLAPADWKLRGATLESSLARIELTSPHAGSPSWNLELGEAWESRHYTVREKVPLLTIRMGSVQRTLETRILLKAAP